MPSIHWVAVTVMVPVRTDLPSPVASEAAAVKIVNEHLQNSKLRVSAAQFSYREDI